MGIILESTLRNIQETDKQAMIKAKARLDKLTKPRESLGRLEDLAVTLAGITSRPNISIKNKTIFTIAADHGVTEEKISAYPQEVTGQMVLNFLSGGAAVNVLAKFAGAAVVVADLGIKKRIISEGFKKRGANRFVVSRVGNGTLNMVKGPAMSRKQAVEAIEKGITLFCNEGRKADIIGIGEMGIGNTTSASAITAVFTASAPSAVTGKGTGIKNAELKHKIKVIERAIKINQPSCKDPIDILSKVGGFEIGAMAGIILAAASCRVAVVLDGFISSSAALLAYGLAPQIKDYLIASHRSVEKGHQKILNYLGLEPLFDLRMRLGEGTGAALGICLAEAATMILNEMATFESAEVSGKL